MLSALVRIVRLFAIAFAVVMGLVGLIVGSQKVSQRITQHYTDEFAQRFQYLQPRLAEFVETARGERAYATEGLPGDVETLLKNPRIVAITRESGGNQDEWIRRQDHEFDPVMLSLPAEWVPQTAGEANLVVAFSWSQRKVGEYSDGKAAYVDFADFSGYDLQTGQLLFHGSVAGDAPPSRKKQGSGTTIGPRADKQAVAQIQKGLKQLLAGE